MPFGSGFDWLPGAWKALLGGAGVAIFLLTVTAVIGTGLSIAGALARRSSSAILSRFVGAYIELFRNTPFLTQLFLLYFGLPSFGIKLDATSAAIFAMTLNYAAYGTEIVGAGIDAVPKGQTEAAAALGLAPRVIFFKIVLQQALRVIYPALAAQTVIMLLETAAVSQIAVKELTYQADMLQARTFRSLEVYSVITVIYLCMSVALRRGLDLGGNLLMGRW